MIAVAHTVPTYTHTNGHGVNRCVREGSDLGTLLGGVGGDDEDVDARVCIFMLNMTDTSYRFSTLVGCVCVVENSSAFD